MSFNLLFFWCHSRFFCCSTFNEVLNWGGTTWSKTAAQKRSYRQWQCHAIAQTGLLTAKARVWFQGSQYEIRRWECGSIKGTAYIYSVYFLSFNSTDTLHPIFNHLPSILFSLHTDSLSTDEGTVCTVRTIRKGKECIVNHNSLHKLIKLQSRRNVEVTAFLACQASYINW